MRTSTEESARPLWLDFTRPGQIEMSGAISYLAATVGDDYAQRFASAAQTVLSDVCLRVAEEVAEGSRPFDTPNEAASLRFSRPVFREKVSLGKTRARRSSIGLWYLFYALEDRSGTGVADTLVVVAVRHSAAAPFSIEASENGA